jgi:CheY-like chemotaxis protein
MYSRILIFEDKKDDQDNFKKAMESVGCEVKIVDNYKPKRTKDHNAIINFKPQIAIVDSQFEDPIDGIDIVRYLYENFPGIPIVVCTYLFDFIGKREWIFEQYRYLPGVRAVIGKKPFPKGQQILDLFKDK